MEFSRIQDFDTLIKKGDEKSPAIIILHGYGADNQDLAPLSQVMNTKSSYNWYFPNGVQETGMGGMCWFPIDMMALQYALMNGKFDNFFTNIIPPGMEEAMLKVKSLVLELKEKHGEVYMGGFSQGSMISAHLAFTNPELVSKLFLLSSTFVAKERWEDIVTGNEAFPIFQSHGIMDPVLPIAQARKLNEFLNAKGVVPDYYEFQGGHEIPHNILEKLTNFLDQ
jgi:phospholipase/carboxylesterase